MEAAMNPVTLTIGEIAWSHYLPAKRQRRRTNTCDGYESSIRLYVDKRWGDMAIAEIDPDDVQAWVDELAKTDAGPGGAWKAFKCLRQIVRWALAK
ncbi:N-terminal phage integrase SAM-like domain-containing protein [Adlercreutzia caecimuris]|nr:N-terminal phage integrase SAM-like domain-containing protein [Adlercreutzia caecimuris]